MMRAAIVGVGFMGWIHYLAYQRSTHASLVGFASRDPVKRAGDWRSIRGNFGPPGEQIDVSAMTVATSLEELLVDPTIDLIDICLPPHLHVPAVEACLAAGKRVLCEKPLALDAASADRLIAASPPGCLMVAHLLPFMPEFHWLVESVADGRYGKPMTGRFQRTISPPDWIPDFYDPAKVGGPLIDLQIHDAHLIRLLFGMPAAAHTVSHHRGDVPVRYETVFEYSAGVPANPSPRPVVAVAGGITASPARSFTHGYEVSFEDATVRYEFAAYQDGSSDTIPLTILHNDGRLERPTPSVGDNIDAFVAEIDAAAAVVAGEPMVAALDPVIAADALRIAEMQMPC